MIRVAAVALVVLGGLVPILAATAETGPVQATPAWLKIAAITFDPRAGGTVIIDLTAAKGQFREIRFRTDQPVEFTTVTLVEGSDTATVTGGVSSKPGALSNSVYHSAITFVLRRIACGQQRLQICACGNIPTQI